MCLFDGVLHPFPPYWLYQDPPAHYPEKGHSNPHFLLLMWSVSLIGKDNICWDSGQGSNPQPPSPKANTLRAEDVTNYTIVIFGKYLCYEIILTGVYVWTYVHVYSHFFWRWSIPVGSVLECQHREWEVVGSNCGLIFLAVIFCQSSNLSN